MKSIVILEDDDQPRDFDFCRPLAFSLAKQECTAEGHAVNHLKWAPVYRVIPARFVGLPVKNIRQAGYHYEFVRGVLPKASRLNMDLYPNTRPL